MAHNVAIFTFFCCYVCFGSRWGQVIVVIVATDVYTEKNINATNLLRYKNQFKTKAINDICGNSRNTAVK